jgi:hypothetical protein
MSILPLSGMPWVLHDQRMKTSGFLQTIATGPSSHLPRAERRMRRSAIRSQRMRTDGSRDQPKTLLLYDRALPHRLTARTNSRWSRSIARLLGPSLDRKIAAGCAPESHLLLAARAQVLVSPIKRLTLAHDWTDLLTQARIPPSPRNPRAPINRDSIVANEPEIRALLEVLVAQTPVHVRGIAVMSWLLADGAGPLYNRQRSNELRKVLLEVAARFTSSAIFSDVA